MEEKKPLIKGQKFGRLTVISFHHEKEYISKNGKKQKGKWYVCKCDCGKEVVISKWQLKSGKTKSCGCYQKEIASKINTKHGKTHTRIYKIWFGMKKRCFNFSCKSYHRYGGRGITVCNEWKNDFMNFYNWAMANGYKDNLTIDRINNNGNYEPNNCRFVTLLEQARNRRNTKFITYNGGTFCMKDLAKKLGLNYKLVAGRLNKGWSIRRAFTNSRGGL